MTVLKIGENVDVSHAFSLSSIRSIPRDLQIQSSSTIHTYVVVHYYYQYIYVQTHADISSAAIIFNLSDKRKSGII